MAFTPGLKLSTWSRKAVITSTQESLRAAIADASAVASIITMSREPAIRTVHNCRSRPPSGDLADHSGGFAFAAERVEHRGDDAVGVEACLRIHALGRVLVLEHVGQRHWTDLEALVQQPFPGKELHHMGAEAARRAFLDGDQH